MASNLLTMASNLLRSVLLNIGPPPMTSNKKLVVTSATLVVTGALLVVTRKLVETSVV